MPDTYTLTIFMLGFILGSGLIIGFLRLTMSESPAGCLVLLVIMILLAIWSGSITRLILFAT